MNPHAKLVSLGTAVELINAGKYLVIAGDEAALRQLPAGHWIGGTIPYFMAEQGGTVTREQVFVNELPVLGEAPTLRRYEVDALPQLCRNAPDNGYTIIIVPAFGACHGAFAENAPNYEEMYMKPLVGWVAGVHLDDLGKTTPKVAFGPDAELSDQYVVAIDVPLPPEHYARVDIVNLFQPGDGAAIRFPATGFAASDCLIDGRPAKLAEYLTSQQIDARLPLVADYCGAMINVSIKAIDLAGGRVEFYAPVFPGMDYRIAAPVGDYVAGFLAALPQHEEALVFSCNCILNFLYSDLEGKRTADIEGPITFGEIAYQLLNQTLVYLTIGDA